MKNIFLSSAIVCSLSFTIITHIFATDPTKLAITSASPAINIREVNIYYESSPNNGTTPIQPQIPPTTPEIITKLVEKKSTPKHTELTLKHKIAYGTLFLMSATTTALNMWLSLDLSQQLDKQKLSLQEDSYRNYLLCYQEEKCLLKGQATWTFYHTPKEIFYILDSTNIGICAGVIGMGYTLKELCSPACSRLWSRMSSYFRPNSQNNI